ncbi:iron-containing alcohol dehydrogenase [Halosimplex pelagicum]|uniref:Iron-containing alcohol dehydrogenase n=1 Tax=Halosimplex pelagicum TaxID=869886 RepID=A0A7D5SWC6_9EURY|nr:iron-containing alcohol dehydrogenase [Halosimplex pelagicum]QLH82987.1 iron-containing alcohol dehydrogenase [Halosimplex pelagicum]
MHRRFVSPRAYVQGAGALDDAGAEFDRLDAERAFVLGGDTALATAGDAVSAGLADAGIDVVHTAPGVDRCTDPALDGHVDAAAAAGADLVVGVGGGVAMDVATAVADRIDATMAVVPTIASTDAPTSTVAVVYDDAGNFREVRYRDRNPELVLVDTAVVAAAPARFLAYGMGDAIATRFEAEAVAATGSPTDADGESSFAARALAEEAYRRVREHGPDALAAVRRDAVTPAVERVVEANTLLSGLGFESGGTAGAHAVQIGLTNAGVREPHGLLVGFGTVAELLARDAEPGTVADVLDLLFEIGLDVTLAELGVGEGDLTAVGEVACEHGMDLEPVDATPRRVADAVRTADELIHERRAD